MKDDALIIMIGNRYFQKIVHGSIVTTKKLSRATLFEVGKIDELKSKLIRKGKDPKVCALGVFPYQEEPFQPAKVGKMF